MIEEGPGLLERARADGIHRGRHGLLGKPVLVRSPQGPDLVLDLLDGRIGLLHGQFRNSGVRRCGRPGCGRMGRELENELENRIERQGACHGGLANPP